MYQLLDPVASCGLKLSQALLQLYAPDHLLLDSAPNLGPLISRWKLDNFKNCWNESFRTSTILTLLCQQFSNLLISRRDMSGPRLGALSNNRGLEIPSKFSSESTIDFDGSHTHKHTRSSRKRKSKCIHWRHHEFYVARYDLFQVLCP